jgi:hypothetical protein
MSEDTEVSVDVQKVINPFVQEAKANKQEQEESESASSYKKSSKNGKDVMQVKVHSPFRTYYDGQAFSLSAENLTGPFDVLPKHHSFISLLSTSEVVVRTPNDLKGPIRIKITGGLIHVKADEVIVFLDV